MAADEGTGEPLRILIVEDEWLLAMDLEAQLTGMGCNVVGTAQDAQTAFSMVDKRPHLALVDLNLRDGLTGPQIASRLSHDHDVVVAFVTGSPHQIPLDYAGAIGAITKPWTPQAVEQVILFARAHRGDWTDLSKTCFPLVSLAPRFCPA